MFMAHVIRHNPGQADAFVYRVEERPDFRKSSEIIEERRLTLVGLTKQAHQHADDQSAKLAANGTGTPRDG